MNKLFDYKRKLVAEDGEEYVELSIPAFDTKETVISSVTKLNQDDNARIDTFTYKNVFKDIDAIDAVMYINHIYNPFAVQEGDIIYIPNGCDFYKTPEEPKLVDGSTLSEKTSTEKTMTYAETIEYLSDMGYGIK